VYLEQRVGIMPQNQLSQMFFNVWPNSLVLPKMMRPAHQIQGNDYATLGHGSCCQNFTAPDSTPSPPRSLQRSHCLMTSRECPNVDGYQ
jgi:hypothetical protein